MKAFIVFILFQFYLQASSQTISRAVSDTQVARLKMQAEERRIIKTIPSKLTFEQQVTKDLQAIVDKYKRDSSIVATWSKIQFDATVYFQALFRAGKLIGTKEAEAFFVKTGLPVTTAEEIKSGIKVLSAGFAAYKPAEFTILRLTSQ